LAGLALALLADGLLVLSVFMPKFHAEALELNDRLIDGWEGAALIACAALIALGGILGLRSRRWGWLAVGAGAFAFSLVIYASTGSRLIVEEGGGFRGWSYAEVGIGLLTAGLGALVAAGAGLAIVVP
jgi:hypothetical protein